VVAVSVRGDAAVAFALKNTSNRVMEAIRRTVAREGLELLAYIKASKLSGQVLKNRTGTLRRSVNVKNRSTATSVEATVGTNLSYAAVHEYGFSGQETVRAHMRNITQAFGKPITPTQIRVNGFSRHVNMPARSFLRSGLEDRRGAIIAALEQAVATAVK
jgi:phage gpG-like protein